jgi:hypothetical protein
LVKLIKKLKQMCLDFVPTSNSWKISKSDQFMFVFSFSHSLNHLALGLCPRYILTLLLGFLTSFPLAFASS